MLSDNTRLRNVPQQDACFVEFIVITGTIRRPLWAVDTEREAQKGLWLIYDVQLEEQVYLTPPTCSSRQPSQPGPTPMHR
ncbi:hypothetical protein QQF64_004770 [Cirrhinus molitorella]|uniref:Uncharacterized protein n=1 Tax=Cirrhinus molitorella TaxID=172907 RepID=A0ABR3MIJ1_9TELE